MAVAAIIVVILLLFLVGFQVRLNQAAIVFTFGQAGEPIIQPGLYWKWPYPIQTVINYDTRVNVARGKYDQGQTNDQHSVITTIAYGWSIDDARMFYTKVGTIAEAKEKLRMLVGGAAKNVINKHDLAEFISTDRGVFRFEEIEGEIHKAVGDDAARLYGVRVRFLKIAQLGFPGDVTKKVIDNIKSERAKKAKAYRAEGKSRADTIRSAARLKRSSILDGARAEAFDIRGKGDAEAAKYYAKLEKHPELAAFLREMQALANLKKHTTYYLTTEHPIYRLLHRALVIPGAQKPTPAPKPSPARGQ